MAYRGNEASWRKVDWARQIWKRKRALSRAARPVLEALEERRMLYAVLSLDNSWTDEGSTLYFNGSLANDEFPNDAHTVSIDWGDGSSPSVIENQVAGSISSNHAYAHSGTYYVSVSATRDDEPSDSTNAGTD
jgi:hypothetical protein